MSPRPALVWLRLDLRLVDHPKLTAALEAGGPVIPVSGSTGRRRRSGPD